MRLRFTTAADAREPLDNAVRMGVAIPVEPGDRLVVLRTGEQLTVRAVDGPLLAVQRGAGHTRAVRICAGDEMVLV